MEELKKFIEYRDQKNYAGAIAFIPYAQYLGITFQEIEDELLFRLPYSAEKIGNSMLPALHGGAIAGFMENTAIMHLMWSMTRWAIPKSIDFTIDYIASGKPVDTYAACKATKLGASIANIHVEAWQSNRDKPIAIARSHFKLGREN